jgi:hypothetical protein
MTLSWLLGATWFVLTLAVGGMYVESAVALSPKHGAVLYSAYLAAWVTVLVSGWVFASKLFSAVVRVQAQVESQVRPQTNLVANKTALCTINIDGTLVYVRRVSTSVSPAMFDGVTDAGSSSGTPVDRSIWADHLENVWFRPEEHPTNFDRTYGR